MNLCILFDMDGTLVNSFEGIFHSYKYTFQKLKLPFGGESFVRKAIGLTLPFVFEKLCGMHEKQIPQAIQYYREFYADQGQYECTVYPGMKETLERLRKSGNFLGVATLKKESFAREILRRQGLASLFDCICGMDEKDTRTKTESHSSMPRNGQSFQRKNHPDRGYDIRCHRSPKCGSLFSRCNLRVWFSKKRRT